MYPEESKLVSDEVLRLCYTGVEGKMVKIDDYEALDSMTTLTTDPFQIDEGKINDALEEYWNRNRG